MGICRLRCPKSNHQGIRNTMASLDARCSTLFYFNKIRCRKIELLHSLLPPFATGAHAKSILIRRPMGCYTATAINMQKCGHAAIYWPTQFGLMSDGTMMKINIRFNTSYSHSVIPLFYARNGNGMAIWIAINISLFDGCGKTTERVR